MAIFTPFFAINSFKQINRHVLFPTIFALPWDNPSVMGIFLFYFCLYVVVLKNPEIWVTV